MGKSHRLISDLKREVLGKALKKAGSKANLSRLLNVQLATVCLWYRGAEPREQSLRKLEEFVFGTKYAAPRPLFSEFDEQKVEKIGDK